jgi:hypothetical protein
MKKFRLSTNRVPGKSRSSVPAELNQFTHVEAAPAGIADKLKHPRSRIFAFITFYSTNQPAILTGTMTLGETFPPHGGATSGHAT